MSWLSGPPPALTAYAPTPEWLIAARALLGVLKVIAEVDLDDQGRTQDGPVAAR